jgi:translation elongation factor EF-Tu-like GTPase
MVNGEKYGSANVGTTGHVDYGRVNVGTTDLTEYYCQRTQTRFDDVAPTAEEQPRCKKNRKKGKKQKDWQI